MVVKRCSTNDLDEVEVVVGGWVYTKNTFTNWSYLSPDVQAEVIKHDEAIKAHTEALRQIIDSAPSDGGH